MIDEEINTLLSNFEKDLFDFVKFVKNVEEEQNTGLSDAKKDIKSRATEKESKVAHEDDDNNNFRTDAVSEALGIAKKILERICSLLGQFPAPGKGTAPNFDSFSVKFYYDHYVYQIVTNLISILEDNLHKFSENLNQTSNPRPLKIRVISSPKKRPKKLPVNCTFEHFKPATLFAPDGNVFDPFRTFNDQLKQKVYPALRNLKLLELDHPLPDEDKSDSDDNEDDIETHRSSGDEAYDILKRLTRSLTLLVPILESISLHLAEFARSRQGFQSNSFPPSTVPRPNPDDTDCTKPKRTCCTEFCEKCCKTCRKSHAASKPQSPSDYQKAFEDIIPITNNKEPSWMRLNPKKLDQHTMKDRVSRRQEACIPNRHTRIETDEHVRRVSDKDDRQESGKSTGRTSIPRQRLYPPLCERFVDPIARRSPVHPFETISSESDSAADFKLLGDLYNIIKAEHMREHACCRGKTKFFSTGQLKPRNRFPRHKSDKTSPTKMSVKDGKRPLSNSILKAPRKSAQDRMSTNLKSSSSEQELKVETRGQLNTEPPKNSEHGRQRDTEVLERGSDPEKERKPLFAKHLVDQVSSEKESGGFVLLPPTQESLNSKSDEEAENPPARRRRSTVDSFEDFSQWMKLLLREYTHKDTDEVKNHKSQLLQDSLTELEETYKTPSGKIPTKHGSLTNMPDVDADQRPDEKLNRAIDNLVDKVVEVAKMMFHADPEGKKSILSQYDQKVLNRLKNVTVFQTGSRASEESTGILIENVSPRAKNNFPVSEACPACLKMIEMPSSVTDFASRKYSKKLRGSQVLEDTCFRCWNGWQRALAIHNCHEKLPPGVLEVRHMGRMDKICACFLFWNLKSEADDWRWQKNPFSDPTRVEVLQEATPEQDPLIMIVYGPEQTLVKESLGETRLRIIEDHPQDIRIFSEHSINGQAKKQSSDTIISFHVGSNRRKQDLKKESQLKKRLFSREERNIACKVGSFFDAIQKAGWGKGPPLVLKLRSDSAVSDAYDLLMVPSNVRLNYYRTLRVIFVSSDESETVTTSSNFIHEDQSDELFSIFNDMIFGTKEHKLFSYACEESKYLYLNSESNAHPLWFNFAGIVLGLAILHQKKMDIKIAPCTFKCLLSRELSLDDLQEIDPPGHEKLMWIKKNNVENRKSKLTFMVRDTIGKVPIEHELVKGGKKITVTEKNKYRFIDLALKYKLAERYLNQYNDLRKGFHSVINPGFLTNFTHKELLSIIRSPPNPEIFVAERRRSFEYQPREASRSETW